MNNPTHKLILSVLAMHSCIAWAEDPNRQRFDGEGNGRTAIFETDGPWMLDWSTRSEILLPTNFEMRLHDGASGNFIGTLVQLEGTGSGRKLFDAGGDYQIAIVASNVAWELEILEVDEAQAAEIKRRSEGKPSLQDSVRQTMRHLRESSFSAWRPQGDRTLLLFDTGGMGYRATFSQACPGLESATVISFVTPATGSMDEYDSILLQDGTRCYFDRVVPSLVN